MVTADEVHAAVGSWTVTRLLRRNATVHGDYLYSSYANNEITYNDGVTSLANPYLYPVRWNLRTGLIEILQFWAPGRHARFEDFVVDALAACVGLAAAALYDWTIKRTQRSSAAWNSGWRIPSSSVIRVRNSGSRMVALRWTQQDFAFGVAGFTACVRGGDVGERKFRIDQEPQCARVHQCGDFAQPCAVGDHLCRGGPVSARCSIGSVDRRHRDRYEHAALAKHAP